MSDSLMDRMINRQKKSQNKAKQAGNAMIYVLVAIVLFAALSMILSRQTDISETSEIDAAKAEMYGTQFIAYSAAAKSAVDQMIFSGTRMDSLDFTLPSQAGFNTAPTINKVYHPDGGGLNAGTLPAETTTSAIADPVAGWYMGRFNNVEWTKTTATDVILVAYQIKKPICEKINEKAIGSATIPQLTTSIRSIMIDDAFYAGTVNADFLTDPNNVGSVCDECHGRSSLCVEDQAGGTYAFYAVIEER
jgi:hypothetical protein